MLSIHYKKPKIKNNIIFLSQLNIQGNSSLVGAGSLLGHICSVFGLRGSEVLLPNRDGNFVCVLESQASGVLYSELIVVELDYLDNVYSVSRDFVVASHFVIKLVNSVLNWNGSEFLEHILLSNVRLVLEIDTEVLSVYLSWIEELLNLEDLSGGFLDFILGSHNFPEFGLGESRVLGNDFYDGDLWLWVALWRGYSSVNVELSSSLGKWLGSGLFDHGL